MNFIGTTYLTRGRFSNIKIGWWYNVEIHRAEVSMKAAIIYARTMKHIGDMQNTNAKLETIINTFRSSIRLNLAITPSLRHAAWFFGNMSFMVDNLMTKQVKIASEIMYSLDDQSKIHYLNMLIGAVMNMFVLAMCPLVIRAVIHLINGLQICVLTLAEKTKELRSEKKRTDILLYQMLPVSVVYQLKKKKKEMKAEFYSSVTVFFSDIVDFQDLTMRLSPMQIVTFLNVLYNKYDELLDKYEVYKVETIGDTYMVASGKRPFIIYHQGEIFQYYIFTNLTST